MSLTKTELAKKAMRGEDFRRAVLHLLSALEYADVRFSRVRVTVVIEPPPPRREHELVGTLYERAELSIEEEK